MAKRLSLDDRISEVRRLRDQEPSPETTAAIKKAIADKSNLVVAVAAKIAGDQGLTECAGVLEEAFDRFMVDPLKNDKLCRAKIAIAQALEKMEHLDSRVFLLAARHVQEEPVWGGKEDTAVDLRAAGLLALTRLNEDGLLPLLVDSFVDPHKGVRMAVAQALGLLGSAEVGGLLLRLKVRLGDPEPEVIGECFTGLLATSSGKNFQLVASYLEVPSPLIQEAAILALGRSRHPSAFAALHSAWDGTARRTLEEAILLAMGLLRQPEATEFLLKTLEEAPEATAVETLSALKIQAHDPKLASRIAEIVRTRGLPSLNAVFSREFPSV